MNRPTEPVDPREALRALADALTRATAIARPAADESFGDADLQGALAGMADRLLERVAAVTALLQPDSGPLDDADRLSARLLISDLSLICTSWQALGGIAAARLDTAAAHLAEARAGLDRRLRAGDDVAVADGD